MGPGIRVGGRARLAGLDDDDDDDDGDCDGDDGLRVLMSSGNGISGSSGSGRLTPLAALVSCASERSIGTALALSRSDRAGTWASCPGT